MGRPEDDETVMLDDPTRNRRRARGDRNTRRQGGYGGRVGGAQMVAPLDREGGAVLRPVFGAALHPWKEFAAPVRPRAFALYVENAFFTPVERYRNNPRSNHLLARRASEARVQDFNATAPKRFIVWAGGVDEAARRAAVRHALHDGAVVVARRRREGAGARARERARRKREKERARRKKKKKEETDADDDDDQEEEEEEDNDDDEEEEEDQEEESAAAAGLSWGSHPYTEIQPALYNAGFRVARRVDAAPQVGTGSRNTARRSLCLIRVGTPPPLPSGFRAVRYDGSEALHDILGDAAFEGVGFPAEMRRPPLDAAQRRTYVPSPVPADRLPILRAWSAAALAAGGRLVCVAVFR